MTQLNAYPIQNVHFWLNLNVFNLKPIITRVTEQVQKSN